MMNVAMSWSVSSCCISIISGRPKFLLDRNVLAQVTGGSFFSLDIMEVSGRVTAPLPLAHMRVNQLIFLSGTEKNPTSYSGQVN